MIKVITDDLLTLAEENYNREVVLNLLKGHQEVKLGILRDGKVIKVYGFEDLVSSRQVPEGGLRHSTQVFEEALCEYKKYEDKEGLCIPVHNQDGEVEYILEYSKNRVDFKEVGFVREFLSYDINDKNIDFDLVKRADVFIFSELEEYTYQTARIILKHFPERKIFFTDHKANMFFENQPVVVASLEEIYLKHIGRELHSVMLIDSDKNFGPHNPSRFLFKKYHSLEVMTSLFWSCQRTSFGEKNKDKTYLWIHSPLGSEHGFTDLVKYPLFKAIMAMEKGIIPVIDLSVKNDNNLFSRGNGDNVWEYYMEQPFEVTVDELMESKNVIVHDCTIMDRFNPYNMEVEYFINWTEMLESYMKLNTDTLNYVNGQCERYVTEGVKMLGVIGHPPHYGAAVEVYQFMEPRPFFETVQEEFLNGGYDKIFLNTEDQEIFDMFMSSDIGKAVVYIPQRRTNKKEYFRDGEVVCSDIATQIVAGEENLCERERRYLSIIFILSKCQTLMASGSCGAVRFAHALHQGGGQRVWIYNN